MTLEPAPADEETPDDRPTVVILSGGGVSTNALFNAIRSRARILAVITETPVPRTRLLRRRAERLGWPRVVDQALFGVVLAPALRWAARARIRELRARLGSDRPIPPELMRVVITANSPECIALLQRLRPRIVIVSGTRILSGSVIGAIDAPFVNLHAGITPRYRGSHGAYWALVEGRPGSAGVTVHLVDTGIDTGDILGQGRISAGAADSVVTYPYLQTEVGIPLLLSAVEALHGGRPHPMPSLDASASLLWHHPGAIAYLVRRLTRGIR